MTTTAQQLAEVDRKLQALCRGPEPRLAARRIMELLDERDRGFPIPMESGRRAAGGIGPRSVPGLWGGWVSVFTIW